MIYQGSYPVLNSQNYWVLLDRGDSHNH